MSRSLRASKRGKQGAAVKVRCETCLRLIRPCNQRRHNATCLKNVHARINALYDAGWRGLIEDCQENVVDLLIDNGLLREEASQHPSYWARVADMAEGLVDSGDYGEPY